MLNMKTKLTFGVIIFGMIFLALGGVVAEDLEQELLELEQELTDAGFEWLINYSVDYPEVEVYEKDKDVLIALFESIKTEGWLVGGLVGSGLVGDVGSGQVGWWVVGVWAAYPLLPTSYPPKWGGGLLPTSYSLPAYLLDAFDLRILIKGGLLE